MKNQFNFFDQLFYSTVGNFVGSDHLHSIPQANVSETDGNYKYEIFAPGFEKSDFDVKIEDFLIKINVEKSNKDSLQNVKRKEFDFSGFKRSFSLPSDLEIGTLTAKYEDGVLILNANKVKSSMPVANKIEIA